MRKTFIIYFIAFLLVSITIWNTIFIADNEVTNNVMTLNSQAALNKASKAEIVAEISQLKNQITRLERGSGVTGKEGFTVYSAAVSTRLLSLYQGLLLRMSFLNDGTTQISSGQWEGYLLQKDNNQSYSINDAFRVLADLKKEGVPDRFLQQFHIFLLPYSIPDISGLGGAGFTMISAASDTSPEQLAVTLDHEIGHHIHMSFMPENTGEGKVNWDKYLTMRGGNWHGPGKVNTKDWDNSSEETFAEDFRMLFGENQVYYGDITLGDPRDNPQLVERLKQFIVGLAKHPAVEKYSSPWIPSMTEIAFWGMQGYWLTAMWLGLGFAGLMLKSVNRSNKWTVSNRSPESVS